jgi:hypothetical protein
MVLVARVRGARLRCHAGLRGIRRDGREPEARTKCDRGIRTIVRRRAPLQQQCGLRSSLVLQISRRPVRRIRNLRNAPQGVHGHPRARMRLRRQHVCECVPGGQRRHQPDRLGGMSARGRAMRCRCLRKGTRLLQRQLRHLRCPRRRLHAGGLRIAPLNRSKRKTDSSEGSDRAVPISGRGAAWRW